MKKQLSFNIRSQTVAILKRLSLYPHKKILTLAWRNGERYTVRIFSCKLVEAGRFDTQKKRLSSNTSKQGTLEEF